MAGYVSRPMGNRLGIHAAKVDARREQAGLTPTGFKADGSAQAAVEKEAMQRAMYRRADERLPSGLGGGQTESDTDTDTDTDD